MARVLRIPEFLQIFLYFSVFLCCFSKLVESASRELDEDNWKDILEGEWMVEFYAPWCPACNNLAPAWKELSSRASRKHLDLRTGAVDVTKSPGLSGRFVVTALPTIFHVKAGEFRQYKGPRDADSMLSFVEQQRWKQTEPVPSWKAPDSLQMTLVAEFFKLSQALRGNQQWFKLSEALVNYYSRQVWLHSKFHGATAMEALLSKLTTCSVHNMLMETYGLPTWGSYLIFAVATIFIGALLGLMLVCVIDLLYPPRRSDKVFIPQAEADRLAKGDHSSKEKSDDDQELLNEDIVDDAVNETDSDAEKNSPSDELLNEDIVDDAVNENDSDAEKNSPSDSSDSAPGAGDSKPQPEVRKRRPRKAD